MMALMRNTDFMFRLLFAALFSWLLLPSAACPETVPDPNHGLYAIWSKPGATDSLAFLKGGQVVLQWDQVEPSEGHYDFALLHSQLEMMAKLKRVTTVQLNANRLPAFLFERVPYTKELLGKVQDRRGTVQYWHPAYVKAYTALIAEFARQVKASPHGGRLIGVRFNYNAIGTEYMAVPPEWSDGAKWTTPPGVAPAIDWSEEKAFAYRKTIVDAFLRGFSPGIRVFLRSGGPGFSPDQWTVDLAASGKLGFFTTAAQMEPAVNTLPRYEKIYLPFCRTGKTVCYAEAVSDSDGNHGGGKIRHWSTSAQWNYWRLLEDLHYGFSMIGVYGFDLERSDNPEYRQAFEFAARYAGFHASPSVAPGAWVALREGRQLKGDYSFLMQRVPASGTRPEERSARTSSASERGRAPCRAVRKRSSRSIKRLRAAWMAGRSRFGLSIWIAAPARLRCVRRVASPPSSSAIQAVGRRLNSKSLRPTSRRVPTSRFEVTAISRCT